MYVKGEGFLPAWCTQRRRSLAWQCTGIPRRRPTMALEPGTVDFVPRQRSGTH